MESHKLFQDDGLVFLKVSFILFLSNAAVLKVGRQEYVHPHDESVRLVLPKFRGAEASKAHFDLGNPLVER